MRGTDDGGGGRVARWAGRRAACAPGGYRSPVTSNVRRLLHAVILACGLLAVAVPAAAAKRPPGDWSFVREDSYRHYACRTPDTDRSGGWRVRTAPWFNGEGVAFTGEFGAYASVARGSDDNLVANRYSKSWRDGYIRFSMPGLRLTDRLWVQTDGYGPPEPWKDGRGVRNLTRCS